MLTITEIRTTDPEWKIARAIRWKVFVEEQNCPPEKEWDGLDSQSRHYLGRAGEKPVATARWRSVEYETRPSAKLERFAVLREERGQGYGRAMVRHLINAARDADHDVLLLHAQAHLEPFYSSFGFQRIGEPFEEVGIPHVEMVLH